jgi:nucleotide-binding universal stress UspA family protein
MFKRLLVPVDGSDLSSHAIDRSIALAKQLGASITGFVVESLPPLPTTGVRAGGFAREVAEHDAKSAAHANQLLTGFREAAAAAGVPFEGRYDSNDDIAAAIASAAAAVDADIIVMATHGRGAFGELLFGSHTKNVMAKTKVPLLVLH